MERFWTLLTYALTLIAAWWAGLHNAYRLLLILQFIDITLGVLAALAGKRFRSNIGLAGVNRRAATWLLIFAVGVWEAEAKPLLDSVVVIQDISISVPAGVAYAAGFFETSSIIENVQRLGVKIPRWLIDALKKAEKAVGLTAEDREKK